MDLLLDEVESLEAILMEDVRITRNQETNVPEIIETTIFPVIGEDEEQQYVCVTLQVLPSAEYPNVSPEFKLQRPRGLDDSRLETIRAACNAKLQESVGDAVVFDLIEIVREHLTGSNLPSGQCVICLYGFCEGDEFTKTECFHYLHSFCLGRHLNALRRNYQEEYDKLPAWLQKTAKPFQAVCPVCRENIKDESDSLKCAMPPSELENAPDFKVTKELRDLQERMSNLYLQQKSRGSIIDVEADSAAVISIESEEEVRMRLHRKNNTVEPNEQNSEQNGSAAGTNGAIKKSNETENATKGIKESSGITNSFAPAVEQNQRTQIEPTNNNYQHNRRHFRGGRRHQHHHHHHNRERDRERYEHHHQPNGRGGTSTLTNDTAAHSGGGKQTKGNAGNNTQTR